VTRNKIVVVVVVGLLAALVLRQGVAHHWRWKPTNGLWDCRTHRVIDDGCSMLGACYGCDYKCAPGTEPKLLARAGCT
jgi:hypothetical protein